MLSVSLHKIRMRGPHGMYPGEAERGNDFEVDVDVRVPAAVNDEWPLIDYARISELVHLVMKGETVPLLEMLARDIWKKLRAEWPQLSHIRVAVRKMKPPMDADVAYSQVCFEG